MSPRISGAFATTTVGSHMTPEAQARQVIDQKLEQAGWIIQDMKQLNLGAGPGVAVREVTWRDYSLAN